MTESAATRRSLRRLRPLLFVPAAELLPEPAREDEDVPKHNEQYFLSHVKKSKAFPVTRLGG